MRHTPLDLRQRRFPRAVRGFDKTEVSNFLNEVADDYEQALADADLLRQELLKMESVLQEHRQREDNLRNTLLTAQKLADEIRDAARHEARVIVRDAEARAELLLEKAQARLEDVERQITELRLKRRSVEGTIEASVSALQHTLEFIRGQDKGDKEERVVPHRPRSVEPPRGTEEGDRRAEGQS